MNFAYKKKLQSEPIQGCTYFSLLPNIRICIGFGVIENLARFKDERDVLLKLLNTLKSLIDFGAIDPQMKYILSLISGITDCSTRMMAFEYLENAIENNRHDLFHGLERLIRLISMNSKDEDHKLVSVIAEKLKIFIFYGGRLFQSNEPEPGIRLIVGKARSGSLLLYEKRIIDTDLCRDQIKRTCEPFFYFPIGCNNTTYLEKNRPALPSQFQTVLNPGIGQSLPTNKCTFHSSPITILLNCGTYHCKTCIANNIKSSIFFCECGIKISDKILDELSAYHSREIPMIAQEQIIRGAEKRCLRCNKDKNANEFTAQNISCCVACLDHHHEISMTAQEKIIRVAKKRCSRCNKDKNENEFSAQNISCCVACLDHPTQSQLLALKIMDLSKS